MSSPTQRPSKTPCRTCRWTRYFLLFAAVLVMGLWGGASFELPAGWDYSVLAGDLFLGSFVVVLALKWWAWARESRSRRNPDELTWLGQSRRPPRRDRAPH